MSSSALVRLPRIMPLKCSSSASVNGVVGVAAPSGAVFLFAGMTLGLITWYNVGDSHLYILPGS